MIIFICPILVPFARVVAVVFVVSNNVTAVETEIADVTEAAISCTEFENPIKVGRLLIKSVTEISY